LTAWEQKTQVSTVHTGLDKNWCARVHPSRSHVQEQQQYIEANTREDEVIGGFTDIDVAVLKPKKLNGISRHQVCANFVSVHILKIICDRW
jgi:hypothetical protein